MADRDYLRYYDLETYLFEDVHKHFHKNGFLDAFDFFSIIIWKANRSKSLTAKRLLKNHPELPRETALETICRELTSKIYSGPSPIYSVSAHKKRFEILLSPQYSFLLPTASAILTVLYPEYFTVYDSLVCDQLRASDEQKDFRKLVNISDAGKAWKGYLRFKDAVEASSSIPKLRDKDRALIGRSIAKLLETDIQDCFPPREKETAKKR
jgi:hypothetical protein